ncbi:hypothetical protein PA598K_02965 [Paenibacillus sp. 598K]|uniref:hypothetical protein n=1 Tax=Paenibacillus sp. 598K TaxID=1117987 RepID=UPI000FF9F030|nr:hypothetical protein [Paenibacillus sp. 598K]GBF74608.1 hypothetical protein PA598K_02965 [Paenibacillus sp. 598K]
MNNGVAVYETKLMSGWPETLYLLAMTIMTGRWALGGKLGWVSILPLLLSVLLVALLINSVRYLLRPRRHELVVHDEYVIVNHVMYAPQDIGRIILRGYAKPYLWIKSSGRREWLRRRLWFRFAAEDQDMALQALKAWAARHQVEMGYGLISMK